jgi:hypothetical protein
LQRIFYGVSKTAIEHLEESQSYAGITKVISINILYFDLGSGTDYIYKGTTRFFAHDNTGKNPNNILCQRPITGKISTNVVR